MTLINRLEKIIGNEKTEKLVNNEIYKFTIDAIAMNVFSLSYALNEKFIAGMDWDEVGKTRLAAAVGNTLTGRPYGIYRDWMMKKFRVKKNSGWLKKYAVDVLTFATGQTPLYMLYMAASGADIKEMGTAAAFLTFVAPLVARPQGVTYDLARKQFGLESAYLENSNENNESVNT